MAPLPSTPVGEIRDQLPRFSISPVPKKTPLKILTSFFYPYVATAFIKYIIVRSRSLGLFWAYFNSIVSMAKTRPGRRELAQYSIKGTNKIVRAGDCVLMRSPYCKPPYIARVENIEADNRNNIKVRVRWYYRPEESRSGRRPFHGSKELFLSNHFDVQSAHTIEGKCVVHAFKTYTKLDNVGTEDYFCRFEYDPATGAMNPDRIAVYCKCELPYNPDDLMVQCEECKDWFHPACVGMTIEKAKLIDQFVCSDCASDDVKKPGTPSPSENGKAGGAKRQRG